MIILFAPAKTFKYEQSFQTADLRFKTKTQSLVKDISCWTETERLNNFKISALLSKEVKIYFDHFFNGPSYQAFSLFSWDILSSA